MRRTINRNQEKQLLFGLLSALIFLQAVLSCNAATPLGVYHNHENAGNKIALTFDDGPHPRYTKEILSVLEEYGVRATFFFVGENVFYYPETARAVAQAGHEIGNHTYTHARPDRLNRQDLAEELSRCEEIIQTVTDTSPKLFRPPQGNWNSEVYSLVRERDYNIILWNIDTLDWAHTPCEEICTNVLGRACSGDIILMHDYQSKGCSTVQALRVVIPKLIERGFHFVTVSELIGSV
jgi:peptidoglycan/xylan/chitin deacetylase (PgdA/CDA1 family)